MQPAALLDGFGFDLLSCFQDGFGPAEIDVGGRQVAQALVVAVMVVVVDEVADRLFQSAGQVVVLKQDAVLQGLMPALDLALGLRVAGSAPDVIHVLVSKPVGQFLGDVTAAIVAEQPGPVGNRGLISAGGD